MCFGLNVYWTVIEGLAFFFSFIELIRLYIKDIISDKNFVSFSAKPR